jgi:hypothetical protein
VRAYSPVHPPPFLCCIVQMLLFTRVVVDAISARQLLRDHDRKMNFIRQINIVVVVIFAVND